MTGIVVGVDGSAGAERALAWALQEARLRSAPVRLVHAPPMMVVPQYGGVWPDYDTDVTRDEVQAAAERLLDDALQAAGGADHDGPLEREVALGKHPAPALIQASADADLLVVGSRGLGGFKGLIVGSVSLQCVAHAHCPVTVVPEADR